MGKRTEKALKEKAAASTSQEASEDDVNKVPGKGLKAVTLLVITQNNY